MDEARAAVEDAPEPAVCQRNVGEALVVPGSRAVELLPRAPSGESGIGRKRRSGQRLDGLPTRGCGGQVTGSPGSEESTGSTGSVTSTGHQVIRSTTDLFRGATAHRPKGPCRSYRRGPFTFLRRRSGTSPPPRWDFSAAEVGLLRPPRVSSSSTARRVNCGGRTRNCGRDRPRCGRHAGTRSMSEKFGETPCGAGVLGRRTSPTHSFGRAGSVGDEDLYSTSAACRRGVAVVR